MIQIRNKIKGNCSLGSLMCNALRGNIWVPRYWLQIQRRSFKQSERERFPWETTYCNQEWIICRTRTM